MTTYRHQLNAHLFRGNYLLFLLIVFLIVSLFVRRVDAQSFRMESDPNVHIYLKNAVAQRAGWRVWGNRQISGFINMAVVNEVSHSLYLFNTYGRLFDSTVLTAHDYASLVDGTTDVFGWYRNRLDSIWRCIEDIKLKLRLLSLSGSKNLHGSGIREERISLKSEGMPDVIQALEQEQKALALQRAIVQMRYNRVADRSTPITDRRLLGAMLKRKDSTLFYAADPLAKWPMMSLRRTDAMLRIYDRWGKVTDSLKLVNSALLTEQRINPFELYRVWQERRHQWLLKEVQALQRKQSVHSLKQYHQASYRKTQERLRLLYEELDELDKQVEGNIAPDEAALLKAVQLEYSSQEGCYSYLSGLGVSYSYATIRGDKRYELTNHLSNVVTTLTDRKVPVSSNGTTIEYYIADVVSAQDYYPFGMIQPGRNYNIEGYRYGFNGQESSKEINENSYTALFWEYDARIGRRWNSDPIFKAYESPYLSFGGNPIINIDPDGSDTINITRTTTRKAGGVIKSGLDNFPSRRIPDVITRRGDIAIAAAEGDDVFRITNVNVIIDENGNTTRASETATLELNNPKTYYRSGGHNMEGYLDDRYALAANAPDWLLKYYAAKNGDIGVKSAIAYQKTVPFAYALNTVMNVAYTVSGFYGMLRFTVSSKAMAAAASEGLQVTSGLSESEWLRIQNAATRINKPITVVGSRASGQAGAYSDWDYVIPALKNSEWKKIKNSLPGSRSILDNMPRSIDLHQPPLLPNRPHITINPR
ncbi:RHS repeat domain-containing protein [Filimonas effusa]|uniref:RHS repeat-associated core domain-containing protein n=1 Tax=Filimonas effusa TaxID=2508721 RepID=A0A4Q1DEU9_9BACT|nr:hypothetical protein [Filimonas effusa]RXK87213.1 hypothetical protein ESB13_10655 [Filimonas effusa]